MFEGVTRFLAPLGTMGLFDLVDITLVALLLYGGLACFMRSRARVTLVVLLAFGGLYLASRAFDLPLTRLAFQTAITVVLVAAVILFQDDLRRAAERLTSRTWLPRKRAALPDDGAWVDTVVECMATLARARIGALCVIKGNDHIEHHLSGGVPLGGKPSAQLLLSLFDPGSPGHDGAVILHRGRVARFGVHLPLSTNIGESGWLGTRHAAALGLSERTDALVLVVSEESGRMRVAEDGRLSEVESTEALKARIVDLLRRLQPAPAAGRRRVLTAFTRNLPLKLASGAGAIALWLVIVGVERNPAPVSTPALVEATAQRGQAE